MRSARPKARRRTASARQAGSGCRCAPRPGSLRAGSGRRLKISPSSPTATIRSNLDGRRTLPATHTGALRPRTSYHRSKSTPKPPADRAARLRCVISAPPAGAARVGPDVDPPAGQPGGEPGVLPFPADRQRELEVRHGHPGGPGGQVDHLDPQRLGRRERVADELRRVVRPVDDVDLLAVQLAHHRAHPLAHRPDAGALGVHAGHRRADGDLGAVTGLTRDRGDLHGAVGDLRHLQREQLLHQAGCDRDRVICGPRKPLATCTTTHRIRWPCS